MLQSLLEDSGSNHRLCVFMVALGSLGVEVTIVYFDTFPLHVFDICGSKVASENLRCLIDLISIAF